MKHPSLLIGLCLWCAGVPLAAPQTPTVRAAVVIDGPWERNASIERLFQDEILELTRGEFDVQFPSDKRVVGDWSVGVVDAALERFLLDPDVDLVLAMGIIASETAIRQRDIPKPLVAPFVIDAEVQGAPRDGQTSGVHNLNYLVASITLRRDLEMFRELRNFSKLTLLHGPALNEIPGVRGRLEEIVKDSGASLEMVVVRDRASEALAAISDDAEAVYVNPLLQLLEGELDLLAAGLIERKLPSFSRFGRGEVERGFLMGLAEDVFDRRARRVALNVQRVLLGEDAGTLSVDFVQREQLVINMSTARAINVFPSFALETVAELVQDHPSDQAQARRLSARRVAEEAVDANLDLIAFRHETAAGAENIPIAKSSLFPQLAFTLQGEIIDKDRAEATGLAERSLSPGVRLSQLIYSDSAHANLKIQRELQRALEYEQESFRLDIVQRASSVYFDVMRLLTTERIQKENLEVTRSNLNLARVRESIGVTGRAEVYRWESQIAADRGAVISAAAARNRAEIALNFLLDRPLEEAFVTEEMGVEDPVFLYVRSQFYPYISSRQYFDVARDALSEIARQQSPEILALEAAILAQERNLTGAERAFFVPDVFFRAGLEQQFRWGAGGLGAFQSLGELFPELELTAPNATNWQLGVDLSLPIFTSGNRPAARRQDVETLSQFRFQRDSVALQVEQRLRSSLHQAGASYAFIQLARDAAEASAKNLEIVTDAYSRGAVSILDLLDAQNASVVSQNSAATAVYDFLIDMLEVERSLGKFYFLASPMEVDILFERVDQYFLDAGVPPPSRLR